MSSNILLLSYFTDLQGSQTFRASAWHCSLLSYFTDLQGSQTDLAEVLAAPSLVTLLIYKVLKPYLVITNYHNRLVTLLIYKVLKRRSLRILTTLCLVTLLIYKVLKQC